MKKYRSRAILALMFLLIAQYACGCTVRYRLAVLAYEDVNANGTRDAGENGIRGVQVSVGGGVYRGITGSDGQALIVLSNARYCPLDYVIVPLPGYTITEQLEPRWNCDTIEFSGSEYFEDENQESLLRIGLAPSVRVRLSKTGSPSVFTGFGQTINYSYVVENQSAFPVETIEVRDDMLGVVNCPANRLSALASMTCTASYVTTESDVTRGSITNHASVYSQNNSLADPVAFTVTFHSTQAPSSAPPPTLTSSVLTGQFGTYCDPNRAINFRLVKELDTTLVANEFSAGNLVLLIDGTNISSSCAISSDQQVLYCRYPAGINSYPTSIQLVYNGNNMMEFPFYGEVCSSPSSGGENPPPPSACQVDPGGFACYCESNPSDPDCP